MVRTVFVSHKVKEKAAAEEIRRILKLYSGEAFDVFVSENIKAGTDWSSQILDNLKKADWLLLLYTDPSEDWDWCLFEAGFFAGCSKDATEHRMICLHTTSVQPPKPLEKWQSVPVTDGTMLEKFIKDLYSGINPELVNSPRQLQSVANEIAGAFSLEVKRKTRTHWYTKYVTLSVNRVQAEELQQTGRVPPGVLCGQKGSESLDIFGHGQEECDFGTLEQGLDTHYKEMWLKAFGEALRAAILTRTPIPRIPIMYSPSSQNDYYVVLHSLNRFSDGSAEFFLLFIEKMPENEKDQGPQLQTLGNMLKLGREFRWEILTKFHRELLVLKQRRDSQEKIKECLERLGWSMDWIVGEAQRLNILTAKDVTDAFKNEDSVRELSEALDTVWPGLFRSIREGIARTDIDVVLTALTGMLRATKQYLIHAAGRYQELLKEMP
jgi:hypothetical protein